MSKGVAVCGIFGVIRASGITEGDRDTFQRLGDQLRHRGPDGNGYIDTDTSLLGMHRLSIMDTLHGWQPFWSEDHRIGVLGNGEIYNAASLRALLIDRGHDIRSGSDMAVIPHLYEEFGLDFVHSLRGMFALAVVDLTRNSLMLVRARMAEKPLYFTAGQGAFWFASEQTALVKSGVSSPQLDIQAFTSYLQHGFCPEPNSLIAGINSVRAGELLTVNLQTLTYECDQYWSPLRFVGNNQMSARDLRDIVSDAVTVATTSDVNVGVALSGGLDSSLVAALAHRSGTALQAFSVGYPSSENDESNDALAFAEQLGIPFHRVEIDSSGIGKEYARICAARDEPIADLAGPGLSAVASLARNEGVPVLLTGLGGDELFWGYEWVRNLAGWVNRYLESGAEILNRYLPTSPPSGRQGRVDWLLSFAGLRTERELRNFMSLRNGAAPNLPLPLYEFQYGHRAATRAITDLGLELPAPEFWLSTDGSDVFADYLNALFSTYLRTNGLTQVDRLSMAHSVESRVPLVDHKIVEAVMGASLSHNPLAQPPKFLLKEAAEGILPASILNRPKRGFTPPVREWLRAIWKENADALSMTATSELLGLPVDALVATVRKPLHAHGQVNQLALRLITLELWAGKLLTRS